MSQPKRYDLMWSEMIDDAVIGVTENGDYVRYSDYAALQAENEKYRRVFQGEAGWTLVEPNHLAALQAENERLRKAGDAMAAIIRPPAHGPGEWDGEYDAWFAAKGVQS